MIDGIYWPSITEILDVTGLGPRFPGIPPERRDYYLLRGRAVAYAIHLDAMGELDEASVHPEVRSRLEAARRFAKDVPHAVLASEVELRDPQWRILGHPDRVILLDDGRAWLIDWKLSVDREAAALQEAGYAHLWDAERRQEIQTGQAPRPPLSGFYVIELRADGAWKPIDLTTDVQQSSQTVLAAIVCYRALERMGRLNGGPHEH